MTEVTQADRDFAADVWRDFVAKTGEVIVERAIRGGKIDDGFPSLFAAFRQSSQAELRSVNAELVEALASIIDGAGVSDDPDVLLIDARTYEEARAALTRAKASPDAGGV